MTDEIVPGEEETWRLRPRQEAILRMVIERHVETGAPVGSKHIAGFEGLDVASSTVRYELARLEEMGLLGHPHTSAGRVPTDRGYRYYVDHLLERENLPVPVGFSDVLGPGEIRREVDAALRRLADVVAQVTNLLGIVTAPPAQSATLRRVEVLVLQPQLVMVVVISSTGAVTKRVFAFDRPVDTGLADWASAFLNDRTTGLTLGARMIQQRLDDPSLGPKERGFIDALAPALTELDEEEEQGMIYVGGQARFLTGGRAQDLIQIGSLMQVLEERWALLSMLRSALTANEVYLRIGGELADPALSGLSLVAANYGVARRNLGTVSLLGPTRMDYGLAISTVREAAATLSRFVEEVYE